MSFWEKFFKNPANGKFNGSPFSLLLVSAVAFTFAFSGIRQGYFHLNKQGATLLMSESPRSFYLIILIALGVGIGALYSSWVAWNKHDE